MKKPHLPFALTALFTIAALSLVSGCGGEEDNKAPSQVVARVNGKEITVHQLNFLLQRQKDPDNALKQKALDSLIDQEILVQKAEEMKLDRDPSIVQVVEQAKREILARAALDRMTSKSAESTAQELADFYSKNPHLFAERKIYQLDNFAIEKSALSDELKAALDKVKTADETAGVLQARGIKFGRQEGKRPAEQLPPALLEKMANMAAGDIMIVPEKDQILLIQLRATQPAPVELDKASPIIKQIIANKNKGEAMTSNIKDLHDKAKIEYVQKFDKDAPKSAASPDAAPAEKPVENTSDALKEGLKGLK